MKTVIVVLAAVCLAVSSAQAQYNPLTYLQQTEAALAAAHPSGATPAQRIAALEAKLEEAQIDRTSYHSLKEKLEVQLFEAKTLAARWQQAYEQASQKIATGQSPPIPSNAEIYNQIRGGAAAGSTTKPQITQVIQTGAGTATVINPDGSHSYIQSTGVGTAQIVTPARK